MALGAALATKMSALAAVPVLLVLAVVSVWSAPAARLWGRRRTLLRAAVGAAAVALVAVAVVWAAYLAVDPRLRWSPVQYVPVVHGLRGLLVELMPFPQAYRDGMRIQFGSREPTVGGLPLRPDVRRVRSGITCRPRCW